MEDLKKMKSYTKFGRRSLCLLILLMLLASACSKKAVKKTAVTDKPAKTEDVQKAIIEKPREIVEITPKEESAEKVTTTMEIPEPLKETGTETQLIQKIQETLKDIYFDYNQYNLTDSAKTQLNKNAKYLLENPNILIQIEGHCDERGSDEYNLALGEKRAVSVKSYLEALGIRPGRISWISYGEEKPLDNRHNESAWSKNRRAHFLVTAVK